MEAEVKLLKLFIIGEMVMDLSCNAFFQDFRNKWQIRNVLHLTITYYTGYHFNISIHIYIFNMTITVIHC